jgi:hypothetical protein
MTGSVPMPNLDLSHEVTRRLALMQGFEWPHP